MGKSIVFDLGPAVDLSQRNLTIYDVGQHPRVELVNSNLGGSAATATIELDDDLSLEAILTDTRDGATSAHPPLKFTTGGNAETDNLFPGDYPTGGPLRILSAEDTSSSSSSSSLSSSSSSSLSSSSSSSLSSSSSSSQSSSSSSSSSS